MTTWDLTPAEVTRQYSPLGLRLLDELTNQPPLGTVQAVVDILDASGNWQQTDMRPVMTPSLVLSFAGLGRQENAAGQPAQKWRARVMAEFYIPLYLATDDGILFNVHPYNDDTPPAVITALATDTLLLPAPGYPFAYHIPVLRGVVVDASGNPVPNVYVTQAATERTLTDNRGTFALPLRWAQANTPVPIDATDQRSGRTGSITIQIPAALNSNQKISIM